MSQASQTTSRKRRRRAEGGRSKRYKTVPSKYRSAFEDQHDYAINYGPLNISSTGVIYDFGQIAQGPTTNNRIGNRIVVTSIWMDLQLIVGDTTNQVRFIVFVDRRANGAGVSVTDVLDTGNFNSPPNVYNKERFRILMDRSYALSTQGTPNVCVRKRLKVNEKVDYASAVTNLATLNEIYILLISDSGGAPHPTFTLGAMKMFIP